MILCRNFSTQHPKRKKLHFGQFCAQSAPENAKDLPGDRVTSPPDLLSCLTSCLAFSCLISRFAFSCLAFVLPPCSMSVMSFLCCSLDVLYTLAYVCDVLLFCSLDVLYTLASDCLLALSFMSFVLCLLCLLYLLCHVMSLCVLCATRCDYRSQK